MQIALALRDIQQQVDSLPPPVYRNPAIFLPVAGTIIIGVFTLLVQLSIANDQKNLKVLEMHHSNSNKLVELYGQASDVNDRSALAKMMAQAPWIVSEVQAWAKLEQERLATDAGQAVKKNVQQRETVTLEATKAETLALAPHEDLDTTDPAAQKALELSEEQTKEIEKRAEDEAQAVEEAVREGTPVQIEVDAPSSRTKSRSLWYQGYRAYQKRDFDEAKVLYTKSRDQDPKYAPPVNSLGRIELKDKNYAEAEILFRQALKLDPGYSPAAFNLVLALAYQLRIDEAQKQFDRASRKWKNYKNKNGVKEILRRQRTILERKQKAHE